MIKNVIENFMDCLEKMAVKGKKEKEIVENMKELKNKWRKEMNKRREKKETVWEWKIEFFEIIKELIYH